MAQRRRLVLLSPTKGGVRGPGRLCVRGDTGDQSNDARDWGPVKLVAIVGKVWCVYWPLNNLPFLESLE